LRQSRTPVGVQTVSISLPYAHEVLSALKLLTSLVSVEIVNIYLYQLLVCTILRFFLLFVVCLSFYTPRRQLLSKALVYYCLLVFRRSGEYIIFLRSVLC